MAAKLGIRDGILSATVLMIVLAVLVSVDPRVHEHVNSLVEGGIGTWSDRLADLGSTLCTAIRDESVDNAPLLVFTTVGALLTLFMFRS